MARLRAGVALSRVAVLGATGFVGRLLVPALLAAGHDVRALTRRPGEYRRPGTPVAADVDDPASLRRALDGVDAAYVLVHRLGSPSLVERERSGARAVGAAAAHAGVRQLVHLGGLVPPDVDPAGLSPHLRARLASEEALGEAGVPVTALRAGIVVGPGSAGWELLRQLATAVPVLAVPLRARVRTQPIAAADLVGYLLEVLGDGRCARVLDLSGADVLTYRQLVVRTARAVGRTGAVLPVLAVPRLLQEAALRSLTDVEPALGLDLLASLDHDAVVSDPAALDLLPRRPVGFDAAVRAALAPDPRPA